MIAPNWKQQLVSKARYIGDLLRSETILTPLKCISDELAREIYSNKDFNERISYSNCLNDKD